MKSTTVLPKKPPRFTCRECKMAAPSPIVKRVANPLHDADRRCSNRESCQARQRRNARHRPQPPA